MTRASAGVFLPPQSHPNAGQEYLPATQALDCHGERVLSAISRNSKDSGNAISWFFDKLKISNLVS
jgi:hypothetical protein